PGAIVDARNGGIGDDAANVIGNTINLYAVGGSIGDPSGGNDLEIDSQRYAYGTIGARADNSIYLTEIGRDPLAVGDTDPRNAQVVLLQAAGMDGTKQALRFTVRESNAQGEDLDLLASGDVLFLENNPEHISHGLINTIAGSTLLRVGDNVNTDPNAQILAAKNIDIYGDFARTGELSSGVAEFDTVTPDDSPKFGTVMHLGGVIAH